MDITVLIRCYNQEQYLYDCIRRLGDNKYVILSDYPNYGKCKRLHDAIQRANTEWIAFNDADDMSLPNRFDYLPNTSEVDLFYSDYLSLDKNGTTYIKSRKFDRELLKRKNYIPFSTVIIRTEIARQCSFNIDVGGNGEDWIWLNAVANITNRFTYVPFVTMIYRNFKPPYSKIPFVRKIKRILWQKKVRSVINART